MDKVQKRVMELKEAINDTAKDTKKGKTVMSRAYRAVKGGVKVATKGYKVIPCHSVFSSILLPLIYFSLLFEGRTANFPEARGRFRGA